jgi:hypothetical protein
MIATVVSVQPPTFSATGACTPMGTCGSTGCPVSIVRMTSHQLRRPAWS